MKLPPGTATAMRFTPRLEGAQIVIGHAAWFDKLDGVPRGGGRACATLAHDYGASWPDPAGVRFVEFALAEGHHAVLAFRDVGDALKAQARLRALIDGGAA